MRTWDDHREDGELCHALLRRLLAKKFASFLKTGVGEWGSPDDEKTRQPQSVTLAHCVM